VSGRHADFVDSELRAGLVWVDVDHRADETDDKLPVQRDHKAMARIFQKFLSPGLDHGIIENIFSNIWRR
jgi:hypothetical protein